LIAHKERPLLSNIREGAFFSAESGKPRDVIRGMTPTHELTIKFNAANPAVLRWLQKIQAQSRHPQYSGDIEVGYPVPVETLDVLG
jgi:hypothetical protein